MKYIKRTIGVLLLASIPLFAWVGVAQAQRFSSTVDKGEVVHSSLYSTGKNVVIKGEIFGDVFCAGQNVEVDAIVHGDVLCAGMDVTIAGTVDGDIRAAGQTVSIAANVGHSATLAGSDVSLDADSTVGQDLTVTGGKANVKGAVTRDVVASSSELIFNGKIGRNVTASSGNISLKSNAAIAGDLNYTGNQKPKLTDGATVTGKTTQTTPEKRQNGYRFDIKFYLFVLAGMILILATFALFFPKYLRRTSDIIKGSFLKSLVVGLVGSLAVPAVGVILCFTLVGIPLAITLFLGLLLAVALSAPIAAYYVGRLVLKGNNQPVSIAAVGALVLVTSYFLPWIGFIFLLLAFWVGLGALLLNLKQQVQFGSAVAAPKAKAKTSA